MGKRKGETDGRGLFVLAQLPLLAVVREVATLQVRDLLGQREAGEALLHFGKHPRWLHRGLVKAKFELKAQELGRFRTGRGARVVHFDSGPAAVLVFGRLLQCRVARRHLDLHRGAGRRAPDHGSYYELEHVLGNGPLEGVLALGELLAVNLHCDGLLLNLVAESVEHLKEFLFGLFQAKFKVVLVGGHIQQEADALQVTQKGLVVLGGLSEQQLKLLPLTAAPVLNRKLEAVQQLEPFFLLLQQLLSQALALRDELLEQAV